VPLKDVLKFLVFGVGDNLTVISCCTLLAKNIDMIFEA
jgi:hypothetical protein